MKTRLQRSDGEDGQSDGASYLELAQFIMQHGANTGSDLAELRARNSTTQNPKKHETIKGFEPLGDRWDTEEYASRWIQHL